MAIEQYPHTLAAIYPDSDSTEVAKYSLRYAGLGDVRFVHLHADSPNVQAAGGPARADTRSSLIRNVVVGGVIGSAVGAASAFGDLSALFVSPPALAPLMAAGYGATLGATAGAIKGLRVKPGLLAGVVLDAIRTGSHVLIVHAPDDATYERAERAVADTLIEAPSTV